MENEYYVYVYLNPLKKGSYKYLNYKFDYEPFYIGKGKGKRIYEHCYKFSLKRDPNKLKVNIINKINNNGKKVIKQKLLENLTNENALQKEQDLILKIGRRDLKEGPLSNLTDGGESGNRRNSYKPKKPVSIETRKKISNTLKEQGKWKGEKNPACTKEHKEYMSKLLKNRVFSDETKRRMSKGSTGVKYSKEMVCQKTLKCAYARLNNNNEKFLKFVESIIYVTNNKDIKTTALLKSCTIRRSTINNIKKDNHWSNFVSNDKIFEIAHKIIK